MHTFNENTLEAETEDFSEFGIRLVYLAGSGLATATQLCPHS